ncbi:unnamed protein product [Jaminaea pallidilutea]
MSFNFDFGEDGDEDVGVAQEPSSAGPRPGQPSSSTEAASQQSTVPNRTVGLDAMLTKLPHRISYSLVGVPIYKEGDADSGGSDQIYLPRRDLFDARFQMLHEGEEDANDGDAESSNVGPDAAEAERRREDATVVGTQSDLVPGVYEGGLKTWECSLDLVGVLAQRTQSDGEWIRGKTIAELGCGTALPSCYLLGHLLSSQSQAAGSSNAHTTHLHLCDYNLKVLELVTLPNLLLAWYLAHLSQSQGSSMPVQGDLEVDAELLSAFTGSLQNANVELHFHSGPWNGLQLANEASGSEADLLLTSETTYSLSGVESLIDVVQRLSHSQESKQGPTTRTTTTLISTKDYYFGLGGGLVALRQVLNERDARPSTARLAGRSQLDTVAQFKRGVARSVLSLSFDSTS